MKQARKKRRRLDIRRQWWDDLIAVDMHGTTTKIIQPSQKRKAYHRPGSQK